MNDEKETTPVASADEDADYEEALRNAFEDFETSVGEEAADAEPSPVEEEGEDTLESEGEDPSPGREEGADALPSENEDEEEADENAEEPAEDPDEEPAEAPVEESAEEPAAEAEESDAQAQESTVTSLLAEKEERILAEIHKVDPASSDHISKIADLEDPERFMKLLNRGYDTADAYWLVQHMSNGQKAKKSPHTTLQEKQQSKNHMRATSSSMKTAGVSELTESEMRMARETLPGLSDKELRKLWKRATR